MYRASLSSHIHFHPHNPPKTAPTRGYEANSKQSNMHRITLEEAQPLKSVLTMLYMTFSRHHHPCKCNIKPSWFCILWDTSVAQFRSWLFAKSDNVHVTVREHRQVQNASEETGKAVHIIPCWFSTPQTHLTRTRWGQKLIPVRDKAEEEGVF